MVKMCGVYVLVFFVTYSFVSNHYTFISQDCIAQNAER